MMLHLSFPEMDYILLSTPFYSITQFRTGTGTISGVLAIILDHLRPACAGPFTSLRCCTLTSLEAASASFILFPTMPSPLPPSYTLPQAQIRPSRDPCAIGSITISSSPNACGSSLRAKLARSHQLARKPRSHQIHIRTVKMGPIMAPHALGTRPSRQTPQPISRHRYSRHAIPVTRVSLFSSRSRPTFVFATPPALRENSGASHALALAARGAQQRQPHRHSPTSSRRPGPTAMAAPSSPLILLGSELEAGWPSVAGRNRCMYMGNGPGNG